MLQYCNRQGENVYIYVCMYVLYICICGSMTMAFTGKFTFRFVLKHSYAIMKTMYMIYIPPVLL